MFFFISGKLYYVNKDGRQRLALATVEDQQKAMFECHNETDHCGTGRMLLRLESKYYWIKMVQDVKNWIEACDYCQTGKKKRTIPKELQPIIAEEPWQIIGMDVIGPFATTESDNRYVFMATDVFSKFAYGKAVKHKTPEELSRVIEEVFFTYGPPKRVVTEQGKDFVGKINKKLFKRWGIKHCVKPVSSPEGQAEDMNRNLRTILSKYVDEHLTDWDRFVQRIVYGINTSYQAAIKKTPFTLMFQREIEPPMYMNIMDEIAFKDKVQELEEQEENSTAIYCYSPDVRGDHNYGQSLEKSDSNSQPLDKLLIPQCITTEQTEDLTYEIVEPDYQYSIDALVIQY